MNLAFETAEVGISPLLCVSFLQLLTEQLR